MLQFHYYGLSKPYIASISYDEYEQRIQQEYGNGVISTYNYDNMRRLILVSTSSINVGNHLQEITYNYDQVGNIASIINDAMDPFTHEYSYDSDNRLLSALSSGTFDGDYITNDYKVTYSPSGKITNKTYTGETLEDFGVSTFQVNYDYHYQGSRTQQMSEALENISGNKENFGWDDKGNMNYQSNNYIGERRLCWTEDNRLQGFSDRRNGAYYGYDATGERALKLTGPTIHVNQNGMDYYSPILQSTTLYASPLITLRDGDYTKHYFEEGKRICSVIGNGGLIDITNHVEEFVHPFEELRIMQEEGIGETFYQCIGLGVTKQLPDLYNTVELFSNTQVNPDEPSFYYTTDHLGSSSYLTNDLGQTTQIIAYMPYGEDWVNRNFTQNFRSSYKYNGKEKDPESGYYNYGARYYGGNLPIWLSVDPLSDKYPHLTPYNYCANNPIMLVDPDGREIDVTESINKDGKREINIKFTANLINNTSKGYSDKEMENIAGKMSKSIEDFYKGQYGDDVSVNVNADIKPTLNSFTAENSRHIISIVDNDAIPSGAPANAENGGRLMKVTERVLNFGRAENVNSWRNTGLTFNGSQSFDRTIAHEFGHLCYLPDNNNMPSLMMQSGNREMYNPNKGANYRRINIDQLNSIIKSSNEGQLYKGRY
ncbi:MAG: RHS repeat-associated core domain-containing protein [Bacteroidales bacterium]